MRFYNRFAIFVDGGFLRKRIGWFYKRAVTTDDIVEYCKSIMKLPQFSGSELFRIYYYDAPPFSENREHVLTGELVNFSESEKTLLSQRLLDKLKLKRNFAVRLGSVRFRGWKLGEKAKEKLAREHKLADCDGKYTLSPDDFIPNIVQKGVDMKIGLDIANVSTKGIAQKIVIISGDTDIIPAMKFARKEGVRVYLDFFGMSHDELLEHADEIINPISFDDIKARKEEDLRTRKRGKN